MTVDREILTITVLNTIAPDKLPGEEGIGLSNVRERLAVQFEGRANLAAARRGAQWCSEINIPAIHDAPVRESRRAEAPAEA